MLRPGTLRYQGWPGCPALTDTSYYETHAKQADQNYRRYERDSEINKRYGAAWRKIRAAYVAPLCEMCEKEERLTPVAEVHHILPLSHGGTHDKANLMSLCKPWKNTGSGPGQVYTY